MLGQAGSRTKGGITFILVMDTAPLAQRTAIRTLLAQTREFSGASARLTDLLGMGLVTAGVPVSISNVMWGKRGRCGWEHPKIADSEELLKT